MLFLRRPRDFPHTTNNTPVLIFGLHAHRTILGSFLWSFLQSQQQKKIASSAVGDTEGGREAFPVGMATRTFSARTGEERYLLGYFRLLPPRFQHLRQDKVTEEWPGDLRKAGWDELREDVVSHGVFSSWRPGSFPVLCSEFWLRSIQEYLIGRSPCCMRWSF